MIKGPCPGTPVDRRGFGASGDTSAYSIEREFVDVAAARTANVSHLLLYEPSLGPSYPPGSIEAVEVALAEGN